MLRSADSFKGYAVVSEGEDIGLVEDYIVDDISWGIASVVIKDKSGKMALISSKSIRSVDWVQNKIVIRLKRKTVSKLPEYNPRSSVNRSFEKDVIVRYDYLGNRCT